MRTKVLLVASVAVTSLLAAGAAVAETTPASYRAQVNGICGSYNPIFIQLNAKINDADKRNDQAAKGLAMGQMYGAFLAEDGKIEKVPVPSALRKTMSTIIARLRAEDGWIRAGLARGAAGDLKTMWTDLNTAAQIVGPTIPLLDAAGLRSCGSGQ